MRGLLLTLGVLGLSLIARAGDSTPAPQPRKAPEIPLGGRVSAVKVHGTVDAGLALFLQRVLEQHREGELVLLDINTLGGRLDSAIAIRDAMLESPARTLCWVHPRAISAGALLTLACDVVAVAPGASIGAAMPVQAGPLGMLGPVEEKVTSYMRREMANTARLQQRPPLVAEAMVDADVEVPGLVEKGKLLTLDGTQALAWGVADLEAASEAELWKKLGRETPRVERLEPSGAEYVAGFFGFDRVPLSVAWEEGYITRALASLLGSVVLLSLVAYAALKLLPRTRAGRALVLEAAIGTPAREVPGLGLEALVGQSGVALTDLRPVGRVEVINKRVEARVERGFVSAGGLVRVVRVEGTRVIVREQGLANRGST
jgi:membrane-bound ClpP family serine protease